MMEWYQADENMTRTWRRPGRHKEAHPFWIDICCECDADCPMRVTRTIIEAARRAEFDYYQQGRMLSAERFIPTPDAVIRAMLEAAVGDAPNLKEPKPLVSSTRIVTAHTPRRKT